MLVTYVVATKYLEDNHCTNEFFSRVGGVSTKELNSMEKQMLEAIGWNVEIDPEEVRGYKKDIAEHRRVCAKCSNPAGCGDQ